MSCVNSIDWDATGSMLQGIGTLAGVGAVIIAAHVGANAWRQQKLAERRLEMAERILTATHKARSALSFIRGILMAGGELKSASEQLASQPGYAEIPEEQRPRAIHAQALINRMVACRAEIEALDDCLPLARAWFNEAALSALLDLRLQFQIVRAVYDDYVEDWNGDDTVFTKKIRRIMHDIQPTDGTTNEVSEAIASAVALVEIEVQPALKLARARERRLPAAD